MVYNFEHEIRNVTDRYLRHLLGIDLFHDGHIFETTFCNHNRDLRLIISCEREWVIEHGDKPGLPSGFSSPDNRAYDKYRYVLTFKDCQYFAREVIGFPIEFLNSRFKDSVRLAMIAKQSKGKKRFHHLRIQTHGGFLDLIFSGFEAHKLEGKIDLPEKAPRIRPFHTAIEAYGDANIESVREVALKGHDLDRSMALKYLTVIGDSEITNLAIANLQAEDTSFSEGAIAAIYALGQHGGMDSLPHLTRLFDPGAYPSDLPIARRHLEDAIEKILYRSDTPNPVRGAAFQG